MEYEVDVTRVDVRLSVVVVVSNTNKNTAQHISTLFNPPIWFFQMTSQWNYFGSVGCVRFQWIDGCWQS